MNGSIKEIHVPGREKCIGNWDTPFNIRTAEQAYNFHRSFPEYSQTPLVALEHLATVLDVVGVYVKDESRRFGLNAFKVLGGSYCIGQYIAKRLELTTSGLTYRRLVDVETKNRTGNLTFVTATDGNHGRGVAWTANRLHQNSVVYMPEGSAKERLENIRRLGAEASVTNLNYDDTVRFARDQAERNGWVLIQDTSWDGYEEVPTWIMQGYTTMGVEIVQQLEAVRPTHIFLQAGVGAMAGAMVGFFADYYKETCPIFAIIEPHEANCIFRTAAAMDGTLHNVTGKLNTIMAGLACGEPCSIGWEVLQKYADHFVSVPDTVAAKGMRILGNPLSGDTAVISGESGAVTVGFLAEVMKKEEFCEIRENLKLTSDSRILCISTEGDTDCRNYRKIVWDGKYPSD